LEVAEDSRDLVRSGSFSHESLPGSLPVVRFPLRLDQVLGGRPRPGFVELFTPYLRTYWLQFLFLSAIVVLSITLFKFRERYRELYGLTELAFGCVSAWLAIPEVIQYNSKWPLIIGSMYINVRGLDNWNQGRAKRLERKTDAPELAPQRCSLSNF